MAKFPIFLAGAVVAGTLVAAAPASAQPSCQVHELAMPKGAEAGEVAGSSPDGKTLTGSAQIPAGQSWDVAAVLWRDGKIAKTAPKAPGRLIDLNGKGLGLGDSTDQQSRHFPWLYENGKVRKLTAEGTPKAIGEDGRIVGSKLEATSNGPPISVPAVWQPGANEPSKLPTPSKDIGEASDVSADGTIVGSLGQDAALWRPDGEYVKLQRPTGVPGPEKVQARRISGRWVIGTAPRVGIVRWDLQTGQSSRVPGIPEDSAEYLAVGESSVVAGGAGYEATRVDGAAAATLPALNKDRPRSFVSSISGDGGVVGGTAQTAGNPSSVTQKPVYWTCG